MPHDLTDIKTKKFGLTFWKTIENPNAPLGKVDMYLLHDDKTGAGIVSICVPYGRKDIAEFILKSMIAGQKVLVECDIDDIDKFMPYC